MKKLNSILIFLFYLLSLTKPVYADFDPNSGKFVYDDVAKISDLETIFSNVIQIVGGLFGFGFFVMLVMGGVKFLLSGGDPKAVQAAKGTITWAIIGLAILALSYTILLLIQAFTGVDVTKFKIIQ